ncbi:MAG: lipid IV(A) 3-deoxy-D-manno-octulosonic acid transferase [Neisseriaceae bacterium]|nr:lipid IV(A) 3-deoxy-D-manno-octulosonic acid transferase [Neisseriaceae bacterium]
MSSIALTLYNGLWAIAPSLLKRYLRKRAQKAPAYLEHWPERFGVPLANPCQRPIWIHAVSVGETRAAYPLIQALKAYYPEAPLLLTQMTPTGRATAEQLYPEAQCRYLPYDRPAYVRQFLQEHQPLFGVIMETELWPNLMHEAHAQGVLMCLANARLSARSLKGYLKVKALIYPAVAKFGLVCAQAQADAERLMALGAQNPIVCGSTKYDLTIAPALRALAQTFKAQIGPRPVVICASTRYVDDTADEAQMLLQAWQHEANEANALLVIVPRHPERFDAVATSAQALGFKVQRRSDNQPVAADTQVWVGDSMGELFAYYLAADIAFVGGSLVDTGCQSLIEPLICGLPTLFGPSTYNFAQVSQDVLSANAAIQVSSAQAWQQQVATLLAQPIVCNELRDRAHAFIQQHQGASQKMAALIHARHTA